MQPLEFHPLLKRIRWGDRRLGTVLGKRIGPESDYAESWEIVDHGNDQSVVANGPYRGWTLSRLVTDRGEELLGRHHSLRQFPLLVKFIDAADRLSVQVHPNDEQARRMGLGDNGKTEAWMILDALPQSRIFAGLKRGIDRESLVKHLDAGTVEECLHAVPVKRGDCVFVPAGTVHAIGEGILLAEVQQSSNVTFRLFDWNRLDANGHPRPLHREQALACINFERGPVDPVVGRPVERTDGKLEELVRCEQFVLLRRTVQGTFLLPQDGRFRILLPLSGTVRLCGRGFTQSAALGDTRLVPAAALTRETGVELRSEDEATILETVLP